MKIIPFQKITFNSDLKPEEIILRLKRDVEDEVYIRVGKSNRESKFFEGTFYGNEFNITPLTKYYDNSFKPVIVGKISSFLNGSQIDLKLRLNIVVMIFSIIWFSGVSLATLVILFGQISEQKFEPASMIILVFWVFGLLLFSGGFYYEAKKVKKYFEELIKPK